MNLYVIVADDVQRQCQTLSCRNKVCCGLPWDILAAFSLGAGEDV